MKHIFIFFILLITSISIYAETPIRGYFYDIDDPNTYLHTIGTIDIQELDRYIDVSTSVYINTFYIKDKIDLVEGCDTYLCIDEDYQECLVCYCPDVECVIVRYRYKDKIIGFLLN